MIPSRSSTRSIAARAAFLTKGAAYVAILFCLVLNPLSALADGMEQSPPGVQLKNAKGETISHENGTAPVLQLGKTGNTKAIDDFELAKYQYCGNDSDCTVAVNGCCDCVNGGIEVAVNKERVEAFHERFDCLHVECTQNVANPPCANGVVSCINHRCQYFDDRPNAAATTSSAGH